MDLRPLILKRMGELVRNTPDLSLGDMLYELTRHKNIKSLPETTDNGWLTDIKDNDLLTAVERFLKTETIQE